MNAPITYGKYAGRTPDRSLGNRKFEKTTVDCGFLQSKSRWGTLAQNPAGLLRFTLTLHEPQGHKLSSAEIDISFLPATDTGSPPLVTEHVYPDIICGPPLSQQTSRSRDLEPSVDVSGVVSIGGLGQKSTKDRLETFRWHLRGNRLPDDENNYTKAGWIWVANRLNAQSELIRKFQLAVVIECLQPLDPFKTSVAIRGKLRRGWYIFKFGYSEAPPTVLTHQPSQALVELGPLVETLAMDISSLNEAPVPEYNPVPGSTGIPPPTPTSATSTIITSIATAPPDLPATLGQLIPTVTSALSSE